MERINATTGSYNFIDLFAGAGGLSEGFIQAGFSPVAHVEMNPYAAQTLETRTGYYYLKAQGKLDIYKDYISGKITRDEFLQHIPEEQLQSVFCETMSNETLPRLFENIDRILTQRGMKCSGHHPFRPNHKNEKCDKEMIPSQRGASNVYFPVMRSAISIPPWINPLYNLIDEHLRLIDSYEEDFGEMGLDKVYQKYFSAFTREEFGAALLRRRQNIKEFTEIKQMEYSAITHHADPVYASNKKHFKAEEDPLPDYLLPYFKRVIRITRLREVRVLLGFTRVDAPDPDADEQTNIVYLNKGKTEKWLPAAEVHGEGVFIEFNRDSIDAWLRDPELGALSQKYAQCYKEFCESKEWTVTTLRDARYVLMHTFAHLLIKQMSMSSGYSSSAIRERIYFGDDMSGVLLYTGSADKEGSLGGLVELGNIDQLIVLMKDAFQEALVCTNDPECLNNVPAGNNSNGAACHSCCMISETACENGNRMLDRGLIVPIDGRENQSYFKTLVEELCQLEV